MVAEPSNEKLERAKTLGADHTINYRSVGEWGRAAADCAGGGIDHIVEVGGKDTLPQWSRPRRSAGTFS
jgi:NADPH:quinone reductase-like Zn-dependent oxidoreductase